MIKLAAHVSSICAPGWPGPQQLGERRHHKAPVLLDVHAKVRPDREFKTAVEAICGAECIERVAG